MARDIYKSTQTDGRGLIPHRPIRGGRTRESHVLPATERSHTRKDEDGGKLGVNGRVFIEEVKEK